MGDSVSVMRKDRKDVKIAMTMNENLQLAVVRWWQASSG